MTIEPSVPPMSSDNHVDEKADFQHGAQTPADNQDAGSKSTPARTTFQIVMVMIALSLSLFLAALDFTIIATSISAISSTFHSSSSYSWIGSVFFLSYAASGPTWGKISDIFGRKPILLITVSVFFFSSLICALSINISMLIIGRIIQGVGAGGINTLVIICIGDMFSLRDRGFYFGFIGLVHAVAGCLGPLVGGVFSGYVSWRWVFWINLPLSAVAFGVLVFFLDLKTPKTPLIAGLKAIDWLGSATIISATALFLIGLQSGVTEPWSSPKVICLVVFGLLLFAIFFLIEAKWAKYPIIPLRLFDDRSNVAATLVCFFHGFTYIAGSYYLPLYFQSTRSFSPFLAGVYLIPYAVSLSFSSAFCGVYMRRTGRFLDMIYFGMFTMTLGYGLFQLLTPTLPIATVVVFEVIAGIGVGTVFQSSLLALQTRVRNTDNAVATSMFGFTRNMATSMSVAIGGVIFGERMGAQNDNIKSTLGDAVAGMLAGGNAESNITILSKLHGKDKQVVEDAFATALRAMWLLYVCTAGLGLLTTALIKGKKLDEKHEEVVTGLVEAE